MSLGRLLWLWLLLSLCCWLAPGAAVGATTRDGQGEWRWNLPLLRQLGLQPLDNGTAVLEEGQWQRFSIALDGSLDVRLEDGHFPRFLSGSATVRPELRLTTLSSHESTAASARESGRLMLRAAPAAGVALELIDEQGQVWFELANGHRGIDPARHTAIVRFMDVRVAARLARAQGMPGLAGTAVGVAHLELPMQAAGFDAQRSAIEACNQPLWPGQPGAVVDVRLADITDVQAQCTETCAAQCTSDCSGAGAPAALVKIVPSAKLSNVGTADVPWLQKFSVPGVPVPVQFSHPYPQPDVHPFLVWNIYRVNAAGQFEQIARSGLKHAFATGNEGCNCSNFNILAPGCSDEYDVGTNDTAAFLSPRREVIPFSAIWGRCHSFYDADCDGAPTNVDLGPFGQRAVVAESDLALPQNAGAQYFAEAWYMVRDDSNIDNNIASVAIVPHWNGSAWLTPIQGVMQSGATLNRWVASGSMAANERNETVSTALGRAQLAVKVTALNAGQYRYDYAFFNRDFGAPVTLGAEPDLDLLRNHGFSALRLPLASSAIVLSTSFNDGDRDAGNQWSFSRAAGQLDISAPSGNPLDWGSLYRISFVADAAPVAGVATLVVAEVGALADPGVPTLVPGAGNGLFNDGFE